MLSGFQLYPRWVPLMPVYVKLFNLILQSGKMPDDSDVWCQGLITPIYKSGDKSDPTNYRTGAAPLDSPVRAIDLHPALPSQGHPTRI